MRTDYDVIVVGAGPAGSSCAKQLVRKGAKALIIDSRKLPRTKCCSGLYTKRAIDLIKKDFGRIPKNLYCTNKRTAVRISTDLDKFFTLPTLTLSNLRRKDLDFWLLNRTGAEVCDSCSIVSFEDVNGKIHVYCKHNNKTITLTCNYLIGADGAYSIVCKLLHSPTRQHSIKNLCFAMQAIYKGNFNVDDRYFNFVINSKFSDNFAWFNVKDDLLYVGTNWARDANYFSNWISFFTEKYNIDLKEVSREGCFQKLFTSEEDLFFGRNNVLLVGEATGLITNTGEGISSALMTGREAANAILYNTQDSILDSYIKRVSPCIEIIKKANVPMDSPKIPNT